MKGAASSGRSLLAFWPNHLFLAEREVGTRKLVETHRKILTDAAKGGLSDAELERMQSGNLFTRVADIRPLEGAELERWQPDLVRALDQEEKTWIFYGNLRRLSKIPAVKKAFALLASMEKEHVDILRRLRGRD